jgi:hypothetical protein
MLGMVRMNHKMVTIAAIVTAAALTGIFSTTPMEVYADETETSTDQSLAQKNTGSGDSANFNCGKNLIDSAVSVICLVEPPPPPPETATLSVCKEMSSSSAFGFEPDDFDFTVTGNGPEPAQFLGSANCVDVTIGPGEYTVSEVFVPGGGFTLTPSIEGECMQDPTSGLRATGEIQAGETQECTFINQIGD